MAVNSDDPAVTPAATRPAAAPDVPVLPVTAAAPGTPGVFSRAWDSDVAYSFRSSPVAVVATAVALLMILSSVFAGWVAPHNPFDLATINLMDASMPPVWEEKGDPKFLLGTDDQGRDVYSAILYGMRISLVIGIAAVVLAMLMGVGLGLLSGYLGGRLDAFIMRVADVQLSFPAILIALLIDGVARAAVPKEVHDVIAFPVLVGAIALAGWPQYARTVRGSTLVEKGKEYVQAARVIGVRPIKIMLKHVLPNVLGPVLVLATIHVATAIITEATLSFLGVGVPPTTPSLGTLIRIGQEFLFSGEWWITIFPGVALVMLVLSVNLLGDWLRDALNPKLR
jgi:peptide/nickel transport system permease protein